MDRFTASQAVNIAGDANAHVKRRCLRETEGR